MSGEGEALWRSTSARGCRSCPASRQGSATAAPLSLCAGELLGPDACGSGIGALWEGAPLADVLAGASRAADALCAGELVDRHALAVLLRELRHRLIYGPDAHARTCASRRRTSWPDHVHLPSDYSAAGAFLGRRACRDRIPPRATCVDWPLDAPEPRCAGVGQ